METKPEVLVIDDHIDAAQQFADLINTNCHIYSVAESNIDLAMKCVVENPIKIVVLDQVMPIPGPTVFVKLKKLNPFLKIVMLTGEASSVEILKADSLPYSAKLHKRDVEELPNIIYRLYADYEKDLTKIITGNNLFHKVWKFKFFHIGRIKYYLLDYKIIDENYIKIPEWKTLKKVNQGEKVNIDIELETTEKISIAEETTIQLKSAISINNNMLSNLDVALDNSLKLVEENVKMRKERRKESVELSIHENEMVNNKKVVSKNYETNQVYKQILLHIKKECEFCNEYTIFPLMIYKPINKKVFRQISYTEDNNCQIVDTGHFNY